MATLELSADVDAPVRATWDALSDAAAQSQWVLLTTVTPTAQDGRGVGGCFEGFTGVRVAGRRLGVADPMRITSWEPPHRYAVEHLGRVVRGTGVFRVEPLPGDRSRVVWREDLDLPLGVVGRLGWLLVRPLFAAGVRASLRRFAALTAQRSRRAA